MSDQIGTKSPVYCDAINAIGHEVLNLPSIRDQICADRKVVQVRGWTEGPVYIDVQFRQGLPKTEKESDS